MAATLTRNILRTRRPKVVLELCSDAVRDNPTQSNMNNRRNWGKFLQPRQRRHDAMLVLSMLVFNFEPGWNRVFNPFNHRENVWRA